MKEEEKMNEENKKELLVLAYNCWWKLRAIQNMANLKAKVIPGIHFNNDEEAKEFKNVVLALMNGIDAELILDITKNYKKQYLKVGSPPFDIVPVFNSVSLQKDAEEIEG